MHVPLDNHSKLGIQQSCHTMPLVLDLNRKIPFLAYIHTSYELYSQILFVGSFRSLDLILHVERHLLRSSAIIIVSLL